MNGPENRMSQLATEPEQMAAQAGGTPPASLAPPGAPPKLVLKPHIIAIQGLGFSAAAALFIFLVLILPAEFYPKRYVKLFGGAFSLIAFVLGSITKILIVTCNGDIEVIMALAAEIFLLVIRVADVLYEYNKWNVYVYVFVYVYVSYR